MHSRLYAGTDSCRSKRFYLVFAVCCYLFLPTNPTTAQDIYIYAEDEFTIRDVRFEGNRTFSDGVLRNTVEIEKSPSRFLSWLNTKVSSKFGRPPNYFDVFQAGEDIERLENFYESNGFFAVSVDTSLSINFEGKRMRITYIIEEGQRWSVAEIVFLGLDDIDPLLAAKIDEKPELGIGNPYQLDRVEREYQRILDILYNNGYAKATIEDVTVRYSRSEPQAFLSMGFLPGPRFTFGGVQVNVEEDRGYRISPSIIYRMLEYEAGEVYSLAKRSQSERNLNRLGIFESAKIDIRIPTSDDTSRVIPSTVNVRPRTKHEITPEILVNDENNAFNIGLGAGYSNRNFMGGARILTLRTRFRVQSIQELQLVRVLNETGWRDPSLLGAIDIGLEVTQPYIITTRTSGRWGVSYILEKHPYIQYTLLRNRIGVNHQFATTTYGILDWTLERISPRTLNPGLPGEDLEPQLPIDRRFEEPQFNSVIAFTLQRDRTDDVFSPTRGFFHSGTIEEGGLLPVLFTYLGEQLPYSQYVKTTLTGRWYFPMDPRRYHILGVKLKVGYATLYAKSNNTPVPYHRRFFAGGSGSVRGWKSRQLGPVDVRDHRTFPLGGMATIEGNIESRINILQNLGEFPIDFRKLWGVVFVDFGNVWERGSDVRTDEIAVATGFGLRYNTLIGPIRFDFGYKLYDPHQPDHRQWLFNRAFFKTMAFHFGIGHAF
jgi:outer membrane protein insertion porin family